MNNWQRQKGVAVLIVIAIIAIVGIGYLLFSSTLPKTNKNKGLFSTADRAQSTSDDKTLQTACKNAINDYPQWTKTETDIIIWENPDKSFNFRNSPEDLSARITSPVPPAETLVDMDFLGVNEISYITTRGNYWKISIAKLNWPNPPDKSQVYEKTEPFSSVYTSPVSRNEFITLVVNGNKGVLRQIDTNGSREEIILEIPSVNSNGLKLAVSPKGTYVYLLQSNNLMFFETASKKQTDKISSAESAVWVGDDHALYSGTEGTYIYNLKTKEKSKINTIERASELTFNPKENGIIAFNENGDTKIVNCQTWKIINSKQGTELKTLTSEITAITKKGDQFGYWRFKDKDWGVKILEEKSKFVTVWQRY